MRAKAVAFYLGLGALFTHELDAVSNHEWRVLPILSSLSDEVGAQVFVAAHVPLFAALIALVASQAPRVRLRTQVGVAAFLLAHGLLHALFAGTPAYEFSSTISKLLIFGGAACGLLYLVLPRETAR